MLSTVLAVHCKPEHAFSKAPLSHVRLIEGHGVQGDAPFGSRVKHRSRMAKDTTQPKLRQVHLLHAELREDPAPRGFPVLPGELGENITPQGIDLFGLSAGTQLRLGSVAVVEITGLVQPGDGVAVLHQPLTYTALQPV